MEILIADEHDSLRAAICHWGKNTFPRWNFLPAPDVEAALKRARTHQPAIALVSLKLSPTGGLEISRQIKASSPQTRVVIMALRDSSRLAADVAAAGACACILKHQMPQKLASLLRSLARADADKDEP